MFKCTNKKHLFRQNLNQEVNPHFVDTKRFEWEQGGETLQMEFQSHIPGAAATGAAASSSSEELSSSELDSAGGGVGGLGAAFFLAFFTGAAAAPLSAAAAPLAWE